MSDCRVWLIPLRFLTTAFSVMYLSFWAISRRASMAIRLPYDCRLLSSASFSSCFLFCSSSYSFLLFLSHFLISVPVIFSPGAIISLPRQCFPRITIFSSFNAYDIFKSSCKPSACCRDSIVFWHIFMVFFCAFRRFTSRHNSAFCCSSIVTESFAMSYAKL